MRLSEDVTRAYEKGYNAGYRAGLVDGNPFIVMAKDFTKIADAVCERLQDPKFIEYLKKYKDDEKTDSGLLEED